MKSERFPSRDGAGGNWLGERERPAYSGSPPRLQASGGNGVGQERGRSQHKSQRLADWKCHFSFKRAKALESLQGFRCFRALSKHLVNLQVDKHLHRKALISRSRSCKAVNLKVETTAQ